MQKEVVWCGLPRDTAEYPIIFARNGYMTAIAAIFDHVKNEFVIAADGRCKLGIAGPLESDSVQKIFSIESKRLKAAYSLSGLSKIGSFETVEKLREQIGKLSKRPFNSGYEFASKVLFNTKCAIEKALKDGSLETIPVAEELSDGEKGRFLKTVVLGFYSRNPFLACHCLYFHGKDRPIEVRHVDRELSASQSRLNLIPSNRIGEMLFGSGPVDARLEHYKREMVGADALRTAITFIRACSDPAAVNIDSYCALIGGHIHAAGITPAEFKWLIPPVPPSTHI